MRHELLAAALLMAACPLQADTVAEPEGYRLGNYDAPVPATLSGATRVSALDVARLQQAGNVTIVDVIPEHRKPEDLPPDQIWLPVPHLGIAGALWLPDVGYGDLSPVTQGYFLQHLQEATGGDPDHHLVFYCRTDCWMSWNAARRALENGYRQVYWFADGIEDWQFEDFETEILLPAAGKRQADEG